MHPTLSNPWFRRLASAAAAFAVLLAFLAWYFRIYSYRDARAYYFMSRECHPIWQDLAMRRIKPGDDVEDLIAKAPPRKVFRHDQYVTMYYNSSGPGVIDWTNIAVIAKDGQLVLAQAASCCWGHTFFDEGSQEFNDDYQRSFSAYIEARLRERDAAEPNAVP